MRTILSIILSVTTLSMTTAQNISDVVRWSSVQQLGTARVLGVGSSFGSMGGDFGVIYINPAGIADFRKSEFTFTPSLRAFKSTAFFDKDPDNKEIIKGSRVGLDNIGVVIAASPGDIWTSSNFAIGYNKIADFNRNVTISGKIKGSITEYFAEQANGKSPDDLDDFITFPAFSVGAIYDFDEDNFYDTDFFAPDLPVFRTQTLTQRGGINEFTLGWAGEYKRNLNLGISIGVPLASFEESKTYSETDPDDEINTFNSLDYTERLNTSGVGFNIKAGFTYKLLNLLRIGGSFQSPTWFRFTDDYNSSMTYSYVDNGNKSHDYDSPDGTFEYKMTTPWRATGSIGTLYRIGDIVG
ncbi:MAG: hypothetical protein WAU01_02200, partial [Saprospiraceae bacterium]